MRRVVLSELLHRRGRTLALLAGILIATTSFTVLTGTSKSQRLQVRGTVAKAFRGEYDILVRPRGSRTVRERQTGEVQPNFLSGLFGGISERQWRTIQGLSGIEVAAPIANIGYLVSTATVPVDLSRAAGEAGRVLLRARIGWRTDRGLTRVPDAPSYVYVTPNRLDDAPGDRRGLDFYARYALREHVPGRRRPVPVCFDGFDALDVSLGGPFSPRYRTAIGCFSRRDGTGPTAFGRLRRTRPRIELRWSFPFLLAAVDPEQEAKLTGLDRSVVSGRFLRASDRPRMGAAFPRTNGYRRRLLPVVVAARSLVDEQARIDVERLPASAAAGMLRRHYSDSDTQMIVRYLQRQQTGRVVQRVQMPQSTAYARLLRELRSPGNDQRVDVVWSVGPTTYDRRGDRLIARRVKSDETVWRASGGAESLYFAWAPGTGRDVKFRTLTGSTAATDPTTKDVDSAPLLSTVGVFDPDRLRRAALSSLASLESFEPPELTGRDPRSVERLHGRPLGPNGNLGGYIAQPPMLLTTLAGARVFSSGLYPDLAGRPPISAIRIRVAGVTGPDAVSRERIRQAAERIATRTGLDVDITAGASGAPTAIDLPAGLYGRPALALSEPWVRKGVATQVLNAVDRKSVVLFALILVVCALFVTNASSAAVRARRTELGVLASLGWSTGRLFAVVLAEVGAIGLVAGIAGGLLALPLAALAGVDASPARAALAIPAAVLLALLAGLVPALRAARSDPAAAVRPAVLEARRAWRPGSIGQLALIDLLRTPGRTALGALSLAIGVCALTLLLAATIAFNDVLVGTLLGDAVAVQVRGTDHVAVIATMLLGIAAVADVLFLNVRERAAEFATLTATGWNDRALGRLVALEGFWIGALGALAGAATGLAGAALFAGTLPVSLLLTTVAAAAVGALLAALAALIPAAWLRRLPAVQLLAEE
jgi:putative ABC transport system permease protein